MTTAKKEKRSLLLRDEVIAASSSEKRAKKEGFKSLEHALKAIKKSLQEVPSIQNLSFEEAIIWCKERNFSFPWPGRRAPAVAYLKSELAKEEALTFDFEAPKSVSVAGSFMLKTSLAASDSNIDVIVEQPDGKIYRLDSEFKDHINWRYWFRRSFYLAVCFDALKSLLPAETGIEFNFLHGNPFKSYISIKMLVVFEGEIRIIPSIPFSAEFSSKLFRLVPDRSNVRGRWMKAYGHDKVDSKKDIPTPYYNYSLISEGLYLTHLIHLHEIFSQSAVLPSALKMIKAWLKQARISSKTSMSGFLASIWMADLVAKGVIDPNIMDELQVFRLVLRSWVDSFQGKEQFHKKLLGKFDESSSPDAKSTLVLQGGLFNFFYSCNFNSLQRLASLASSSLAFSSSHPDRLDRLFLSDVSLDIFSFDVVVESSSTSIDSLWAGIPCDVPLNYGCPVQSGYLENRLALVLRKGLSDRIRGPFSVTCDLDAAESSKFKVKILASLDPAQARRLVDLGPTSEEIEAAAKFRGFWGTKAELRQFKDAAIRECVSWEEFGKKPECIPFEIIQWLLSRHFGIKRSDITCNRDVLNFPTADSVSPAKASIAFAGFNAAFDGLSRDLRALNSELPLSIVHCVGIASAFSHSSLKHPEKIFKLSVEQPCSQIPGPSSTVYDFLIRFERSSAWPDELQALQAARQAFLLQLRRSLLNRQVATDCLVSAEFVDIYYGGFLFRGWIEVPREILRLKAEGASEKAIKAVEKRTFWSPRLASALSQLDARTSGIFSATARLMKAFLSGHLLVVEEDFIDALVALVFLETDQLGSANSAWSGSLLIGRPAGSVMTGFLRALELLTTFPWADRPLLLDFSALDVATADYNDNEKMAMNGADWSVLKNDSLSTSKDSFQILTIFSKEQKAMVVNALQEVGCSDAATSSTDALNLIPLYPIAPVDKSVFVRLKLLARLTMDYYLQAGPCSSLASLFAISAEAIKKDFDVLVKLDVRQLQMTSGAAAEGLGKIFRNSNQPSPMLFTCLPGFSVVARLYADLKEALKPFGAILFYNPANPIIMAVRVKQSEKVDEVVDAVKFIAGDLVLDIKKTN